MFEMRSKKNELTSHPTPEKNTLKMFVTGFYIEFSKIVDRVSIHDTEFAFWRAPYWAISHPFKHILLVG